MGDDVLLFGFKNKVMKCDGPTLDTIFEHPDKNIEIYSLMQIGKRLLVGSEYDLRNVSNGRVLVKTGSKICSDEPITSILEYNGRILIFSGAADGKLIDVASGKTILTVDEKKVHKDGMRGGPGTVVKKVKNRLFLANEELYEIVPKKGDLSKSSIIRKTEWISDHPRIFTWRDDLFDMCYHNEETHPNGAELRWSSDRMLVAYFPTFSEKYDNFIHHVAASKSGDFWCVTVEYKEHREPNIIRVYKQEGLMEKLDQKIKNPEPIAEVKVYGYCNDTNPALVIKRKQFESIIKE